MVAPRNVCSGDCRHRQGNGEPRPQRWTCVAGGGLARPQSPKRAATRTRQGLGILRLETTIQCWRQRPAMESRSYQHPPSKAGATGLPREEQVRVLNASGTRIRATRSQSLLKLLHTLTNVA
jgi:hypothetical protein